MVYLRRNKERGPSDLGWLQSRHTFSFSRYYDPDHMGVSVLRVINDDQVQPGTGFATHSHQDMEIISYVKQGSIEHKDSMGNVEVLPAGEFQLMSAGTGVTHSEYNPSDSQPLSFFQIWIEPAQLGVTPGYQQKHFETHKGLTHIVSPDGRDGTLRINQDAHLYQLRLDSGQTTVQHRLAAGRTLYVHVVSGRLEVNDHALEAGDGIGLSEVEIIQFSAQSNTEALLFDLP
ncbi:MAG: pirin family protein [Gammaproteobacteria bacterium]|nr:MAG: pirin family protein [Gammaproteobacteria bacterium]